MKLCFATFALAGCLSAASHAAGPASVPAGLLACGQVQDIAERAHCYDAQVAVMKQATAQPPASTAVPVLVPVPAPVPTPPATTSTESQATKFGQEQLPAARRPEPAPQDEILLSNIASVRTVGPKIWLISLANGQIWRQEGTQITVFFRPGDDVRIEKGILGSYRMSTPRIEDKNWVRVTRVR